MVKSELAKTLMERGNMTAADATQAVDTFFDCMVAALKSGHRIELRGFGSFDVREYDGYMGRNPRTGDTIPVAPKRLPYFKAGKEIRESIKVDS